MSSVKCCYSLNGKQPTKRFFYLAHIPIGSVPFHTTCVFIIQQLLWQSDCAKAVCKVYQISNGVRFYYSYLEFLFKIVAKIRYILH